MKYKIRKALIPMTLGVSLLAGFVGSLSGSLAWWAYSTRTAVSYNGTSVSTSVQLETGFKVVNFTDDQLDALELIGLVEDTDLRKVETIDDAEYTTRYLFSNSGSALLGKDTIANFLLIENRYAVDRLFPVTSSDYTITETDGKYNGEHLTALYDTLTADLGNVWDNVADEYKYVHIPFVFRVRNSNGVLLGNQKIWLTDVKTTPDETSELDPSEQFIEDSLRVYFDNGSTRLILNPKDDYAGSDVKNIATYGCLDLNNDGKYDYSGGKETLYGQYTGEATDTFLTTDAEDPRVAGLSDINDTGADNETPRSTFYAAHTRNITCYNSYTGITGSYADYVTLNQIKPEQVEGVFSGGTPLVVTPDDTNKLAELDMRIWLEGWDHHVIDTQIGAKFNLGLQFEINYVR